jgi:hypothetical protein
MDSAGSGGGTNEPEAVRSAREFGVDITLLLANLKLAPSERVRRAQRTLDSVQAVREQSAAARRPRGR